MDSDAVEFTYQGVKLAYSKLTGKSWSFIGDEWKLTHCNTTNGYTQLNINGRKIYIHRIIAEVFLTGGQPLAAGQVVDHKEAVNGSHYQEQLENLRICTRWHNQANHKRREDNVSGYKGVGLYKPSGKWRARIRTPFGARHLGHFETAEQAAKAYDAAAVQIFGEFALTNERLGTLKHVD